MTNLATLNTLLSIELGDSESINKTDEQRNLAINNACFQIYEYRNWPEKYENTTTQAVDGIITIPNDYDINAALWYGKNQDYGYQNYKFINQTDFFTNSPLEATITEEEGIQVIKINQDEDRGFAISQKEEGSLIGINDVAANERVGQTFTATDDTIEGSLLKLNTFGSPSGTLAVEIYATAANLPTGAALASGTISIANVTTQSQWQWVKFNSAVTLTVGTQYALVVTSSYATSATDYVQWAYTTNDVITGNQVLFDGLVWAAGAGDQAFILASDFFKTQYVKRFIPMAESTDDNGLSTKFDQAIAKMAAGIICETKSKDEKALRKFYGLGGSQRDPAQNSAFGLLDLIWTNNRINSTRQEKRLKTIFDRPGRINFTRNYYYR